MDIQSALADYGIPFKRSGKQNEVWICCPFCVEEGESPDTKFRLGLNVETGWMGCFNCKKGSKDEMYTWRELERVWKTEGLSATSGAKKPEKKVRIRLPKDFEVLVRATRKQDYWQNMAFEYVHRRGVTEKQIKEKQIGFSMEDDTFEGGCRMAYRIIFPVRDENEKLVMVVGRDFTGKREPKYKNSVGDKYVYNVKKKKKHGAMLVEGIFDSLSAERGVRHLGLDSLGVLGHSLTDIQWKQLEDYERFVLWPDPDRAGIIGEGKDGNGGFMGIARELQRKKKEVLVVTPKMEDGAENFDPSELFPPEIEMRVKRAKPYTQELEQRLRAWLVFKED